MEASIDRFENNSTGTKCDFHIRSSSEEKTSRIDIALYAGVEEDALANVLSELDMETTRAIISINGRKREFFRHNNADGNIGGFVESSLVLKNCYVELNAIAFGKGVIKDMYIKDVLIANSSGIYTRSLPKKGYSQLIDEKPLDMLLSDKFIQKTEKMEKS
ncbi:MAG: hypothetical protein ACP5RP_03165 [Candidatus Micrarchaeia archaeon]